MDKQKKRVIRFNISTQRWYHYFIDIISRWIRKRRIPEHTATIILNVKFTKDWKFVKTDSIYMHEVSEGLPLSEAKIYTCPACIYYDLEEDMCNHRKCKVNLQSWEDEVPDWCPLNNGEGIITKHENNK